MNKVRLGIIGYGTMGELYAGGIAEFHNAEVAAVADNNPQHLKKAQDKHNCRGFEAYQDMYSQSDLDAVIIILPDHLHREAVIGAAEAGLHVFVEKPFATSVQDARAMVEAVEKAKVKCMIEFMNRWSAPFVKAKELADEGKLGFISSISADLNDSICVPTKMLSWSSRSTPGWFLMCHTFDLATWITGKEPASVFATGTRKILAAQGIDTYDAIEALVNFTDGSIGRFTNNWVLPEAIPLLYELKLRLVGAEAAIDIDTSDQQLHYFDHSRYEHTFNAWGKVFGKSYGHCFDMLRTFVDCIQNDLPVPIPAEVGLKNTIFIEAVHKSIETGLPVNIGD